MTETRSAPGGAISPPLAGRSTAVPSLRWAGERLRGVTVIGAGDCPAAPGGTCACASCAHGNRAQAAQSQIQGRKIRMAAFSNAQSTTIARGKRNARKHCSGNRAAARQENAIKANRNIIIKFDDYYFLLIMSIMDQNCKPFNG